MPLSSLRTAKLAARLADEKKAEDIVILDMRDIVNYCDFFVICSGQSSRQVKAIADYIEDEFRKNGQKVYFNQKLKNADWIVFDTGNVVIHVFEAGVRDFYRLEYLWQEAKKIGWAGKA